MSQPLRMRQIRRTIEPFHLLSRFPEKLDQEVHVFRHFMKAVWAAALFFAEVGVIDLDQGIAVLFG